MSNNLIHELKVFENFQVEVLEEGHVVLSTQVVDSSLNYHGNAHGGYLFTLSDQVAGLTSLSMGTRTVTQQASINYIKAGHLGDRLFIEGSCIHRGKSTQLIEVLVKNQAGVLIAKTSFNMFSLGTIEIAKVEEMVNRAIL